MLSFTINEDESKSDRTSLNEHYSPSVEIKDYNVLIDGKSFVNLPRNSKEEKYKKIIEVSKNTQLVIYRIIITFQIIINLLKLQTNCKQIELDWSWFKQTNWIRSLDLKQQINFIGWLREACETTMFFIIEKSEETTNSFITKNCTHHIKWKLKRS